jgi:acyl-CoA thioesterase-1
MPRLRLSSIGALTALAVLAACSLRTAACRTTPGGSTELAAQASLAKAPGSGEPVKLKIAFLGDSVTAGFGLLSDQAYPAILEAKFAAEGYHEVESVNGGLTGDTTAGALRRLDQLLEPEVKILVVALGGNDALRGLTPAQTHDNLAAIVDAARAKNVSVLLVGMLAPTNLGEDYRTAFSQTFVQLAREYKDQLEYVPFLLEGVAGRAELNQDDGIHPNEEGAKIVAETLYPKLRMLVDQVAVSGGG